MIAQSVKYLYLYGITGKIPQLNPIAGLSDNLYCIPASGLYMIVGDVDSGEFGEDSLVKHLESSEWLRPRVELHERIIEQIMGTATVIPFKFATVFFSEQNLADFVKKYAVEFQKMLLHLDKKEEWGIKIYYNVSILRQNVITSNESVIALDREIGNASPGKAYLLNRKRQQVIDAAVQEAVAVCRKTFLYFFTQPTFNIRSNKLISASSSASPQEMILNLAILLNKNANEELLDLIKFLTAEFSPKGFFFDCTGPWPPYNFCQLETGANNG